MALDNRQNLPEGLLKIHALLGEKRYTPGYVFDRLNMKQRTALVLAAGLPCCRQGLTFAELENDDRLKLQRALLTMNSIYQAFLTANALTPEKFITKDKAVLLRQK